MPYLFTKQSIRALINVKSARLICLRSKYQNTQLFSNDIISELFLLSLWLLSLVSLLLIGFVGNYFPKVTQNLFF